MTKSLDNGIPVLMVDYPDGQTATIGITYNVGGRNEWKDKTIDGISHFLEHQFFKGNENIDAFEVSKALDDLGGITNAFTTEDTTCYFTKCLNTEIDDAIDLWNELLRFGEISQEEFDKEAFVVKQEFRRLEDNPPALLFREIKKNLFAGTSLEMDVIGTEESLSNMTLKQMERYREEHYGLENAALMVLGNFNTDLVFKKLNETFGRRGIKGDKPKYELTDYTPESKSVMKTVHIDKETPLTFFGFGLKTPGGKSEEQNALNLFMAHLTLGESSLIQKKLVKSGICSFATSFTQKFEDIGCMVFIAGTPPQMYETAHNTAMQMLWDALHEEITQDDLDSICKRLEYDLRSTFEEPMMMLYAQSRNYWRTGEFKSLETILEELKSVKVEEFNNVRNMILFNLNGVYGTLGKTTDVDIGFPENTWDGEFEN